MLQSHINGEIAGETGYDKSGPSPLSDSFSNSIGEVGSRTEISSWYEFDVFFCMAGVLDADMGDDPDPDASSIAEISMIFRPYGNSFEIHTTLYDEWWGARSYVRITDTDQTIEPDVFYADFFGGSPDGVYAIDPDHIYELYVYTGADLHEGEGVIYNFAVAEVYFRVIPEPTTLLLLGLGAFVLRRKR